MEYRLKNLHDAACRNIRCIGKYKPYEKFSDRNELIMKRLLSELMEGKVDYVSLKDDERFLCLHRSPKGEAPVQLSVGWWKDGFVDPSYHVNIHSYEDLRYEGYPEGIWVTGTVA